MWCLRILELGLYFAFISAITNGENFYKMQELYIKQKVDHFSFSLQDTYLQRYLLSDIYWKRDSGPIFFYTGNENDIETISNSTGFVWDIAPTFHALVIFAEHRYYGKSLPYGNLSFNSPQYFGYLTTEQVLADYVQLITALKKNIPGAENVPVIAFGGSYGGVLAAWIRMKYPHIVHGVLASSAPILHYANISDCNEFNKLVTNMFVEESLECTESIRKTWDVINAFNKTEEGRLYLSQTYRLCSPILTDRDLKEFKAWLQDVYSSVAIMNYPYPSKMLSNLPAWPIKEVCKHLTNSSLDGAELMDAVFAAVSVYSNYTGTTTCVNSKSETSDFASKAWNIQGCIELVVPLCPDGVTDMYERNDQNHKEFLEECYEKFQTRPMERTIPIAYGSKDLSATSNIIFSNGDQDPWRGGGILKSVSDSIVSIVIKNSGHHMDLRSATPFDPISVVNARELEISYIRKFINSYYEKQFK